VLYKSAIAVTAINPVAPVERIIDQGVAQGAAAAVTGNFIGGIGNGDNFWGRGGVSGHYGKSRELYLYRFFIDLKQTKTKGPVFKAGLP